MSQAPEKQSPLKDKRALIVVGVIALGLAVTFFGGGSDEVESVDVAPKPIELGSDPINNIGSKDRDAALTVFGKQIESLEQRLILDKREDDTEKERLRQDFKNDTNTLKAQIATLSEELIALRANGIDATYANANANDRQLVPSLPDSLPTTGLNFDMQGLNFNMDAPTPSASPDFSAPNSAGASTYGPNYFVLKPAGAGVQIGPDGKPVDQQASMFNMSNPGSQTNGPAPQQTQQPQKQYASAAEAYEDQSKSEPDTIVDSKGITLKRVTIPAFSFVEVTTLHGVACPVGANSPDSQGKSEIPARPVVMPVRGIYRGPNGSSVDVGNIHLMGLCSGRRTSSSTHGRATIRVEQMSYWSDGGDAQMTTSTGYIVDTRDNEQDVWGRLDKASGRTLALESAAASGAAFAAALSQSEYTTQNNMNTEGGSSTVSQLTGSATKAATSQGIAALFANVAKRFEQEANATIDTVIVDPGIRLRFVTDQPIHVYEPAEPFELSGASTDVLL